MIIAKVREQKGTGQKTATVPSDCEVEAGDYVSMKKIREEDLD